jgi:hypothetical protein
MDMSVCLGCLGRPISSNVQSPPDVQYDNPGPHACNELLISVCGFCMHAEAFEGDCEGPEAVYAGGGGGESAGVAAEAGPVSQRLQPLVSRALQALPGSVHHASAAE